LRNRDVCTARIRQNYVLRAAAGYAHIPKIQAAGAGTEHSRVPIFETVKEAGLLVTLPVLFLTTTVNCAPLSDVVVTAVV
jgi:hypothetical protein